MNSLRGILWMVLLGVSFLLWQAWMTDYVYPKPTTQAPAPAAQSDLPSTTAGQAADVPSASQSTEPGAAPSSVADAATASTDKHPPIRVRTDLLDLQIEPVGGSVSVVDLLAYRVDAKKPEPKVRLFDNQAATWFVAQSGLVSTDGTAPNHQALFQSASQDYQLAEGQNQIEVPLTWQNDQGLKVTKTLVFTRGSYLITERWTIDNQTGQPFKGNAYEQLQRAAPPHVSWSLTNPQSYSFVGAAWYSEEEKFEKLAFDKFEKDPLARDITGGWAAMLQHYFFAAWIPPANEAVRYESRMVPDPAGPRYLVRALSPVLSVPAGDTLNRESRLYVGPKLQNDLAAIAPGLPYVIDYGKITFISEPLFWLLNQLHKLVNNWGLAIVLVVVFLKLALYPLSEMQYRSMAKMRKLQPRIQELQQRYGEDRQKLNQAMLELYQKEKANPASGCLPLLLTIPVFIALYWVLLESVELRHAPFYGWIQNLSERDPYFILPALNALTMWLTQKLSPAPAGMDPLQQKVLMYMPLILSLTFAFFPSGLVLYWTVNGTLGLLQQWIIIRRYEAKEPKAA
ncbi:membrane protein insertase YidC [Ahniella affigens]|uniref:Membrane protein insertase YidC n=1 Tax=Ahniella affigens TaxID=2021234 RepID=A0A2P1PVY9_9GAMM|nr:membrane protein insertase YidC [Ahniella affigens]AVP99025.1 membrane protein insertase YidC [Ahniella affigens]